MKNKMIKVPFSKVIHSTEELINGNLLKIDTEKHSVILVEDVWKIFDQEGRDNFIKNMADYCKLKNTFNGIPEIDSPELLIFIKDKNQKIVYHCKFKNNKVEYINL
jgi:hypothetical protein